MILQRPISSRASAHSIKTKEFRRWENEYLARKVRAAQCSINKYRTRLLMQSNPVFCGFIDEIYATFDVCGLWVLANESGDHPWHSDRFSGGQAFRNLVTFGTESKVMWFRCRETEREFGISLPHSALVCIGRHAAGVTSGIQHRVTGGANSWLVVFENK